MTTVINHYHYYKCKECGGQVENENKKDVIVNDFKDESDSEEEIEDEPDTEDDEDDEKEHKKKITKKVIEIDKDIRKFQKGPKTKVRKQQLQDLLKKRKEIIGKKN